MSQYPHHHQNHCDLHATVITITIIVVTTSNKFSSHCSSIAMHQSYL